MRTVTRAQSDQAADVLAHAFVPDPSWAFLVPSIEQRRLLIRQSFRATMPYVAASGQLYGVGDPLDAIAAWRTPNQRATGTAALLNVHMLLLLFNPSVHVFRRAFPIFAQFNAMHRRYASDPHYYLETIGVAPTIQGKGLASALIKPMLARADTDNCAAYTETMTPSVVPLYEHYGFVCQERFDVPQTDLHIWALLRAPRTSPSTSSHNP